MAIAPQSPHPCMLCCMQMAMVFVRCRGGVSHSPLESVLPDDVAAATAALAQYLIQKVVVVTPTSGCVIIIIIIILHFQLRPACGLHEYTSQAALEHTQASVERPISAADQPDVNCVFGSCQWGSRSCLADRAPAAPFLRRTGPCMRYTLTDPEATQPDDCGT